MMKSGPRYPAKSFNIIDQYCLCKQRDVWLPDYWCPALKQAQFKLLLVKILCYTTHHIVWIPTSFRCTTAGVQSHISIIEISYAFLFLCTECSYDPACPSQLTYSSYTKCRPHYTLQHSHSQCKSICWSVCHTSYNITQYVPSHGNRSSQWWWSFTQVDCSSEHMTLAVFQIVHYH